MLTVGSARLSRLEPEADLAHQQDELREGLPHRVSIDRLTATNGLVKVANSLSEKGVGWLCCQSRRCRPPADPLPRRLMPAHQRQPLAFERSRILSTNRRTAGTRARFGWNRTWIGSGGRA